MRFAATDQAGVNEPSPQARTQVLVVGAGPVGLALALEIGLRGIEVSSQVNGLELADPKFERFWAKAEELGCIVFLHPLGSSLGERLNQHYLSNTIGQPLETAVALSYGDVPQSSILGVQNNAG